MRTGAPITSPDSHDGAEMPNREAHSREPDSDDVERARLLLAQALANNPIDRKLVLEAYRLLTGLPDPENQGP